jgi:hypothetical protein
MSEDAQLDRKSITFEQAEGSEPLPTQLALGELSPGLRALVWSIFVEQVEKGTSSAGYAKPWVSEPWRTILADKFVLRDHRMLDEFSTNYETRLNDLKTTIVNGNYTAFFGLLQWLIRHRACPPKFKASIAWALERERAAYRLVDGDTIVPFATAEGERTLKDAFADLRKAKLNASRQHLRDAAEAASNGEWAASIRESVNAVESVSRNLAEGAKELGPALASLEKAQVIHPALKRGFSAIYGFSSDEKGLRHPLIDEPVAAVDETDALFMLGACAAFVSYLIHKGRTAGLLVC